MITKLPRWSGLSIALLSVVRASLALEPVSAPPIDRMALVRRHNVVLTSASPVGTAFKAGERELTLQVGNGGFAYGGGRDRIANLPWQHALGLGLALLPLPKGTKPSGLRLKEYDAQGRKVGYPTEKDGQEPLYFWLRNNPHRFNLGRLSMRLVSKEGELFRGCSLFLEPKEERKRCQLRPVVGMVVLVDLLAAVTRANGNSRARKHRKLLRRVGSV